MLVKAELRNTRLGCEKDTAADVGFRRTKTWWSRQRASTHFLSHHCTRECSSVFTGDAPTVKFCSNAEVSNNNLYYRDDFASVELSLFLFPAVPRKQYSS